MDELDRLYRRLVQNVRAGFPDLLTRPFEVAQLYQQVVPYRTNRRELALDSNDEYELALMQLLAGLRGYLTGDTEMQGAMRRELASANPDLGAYRLYATSAVALAPEPLRTLEQQPGVRSPAGPGAASYPSPAEQVILAGRATEAVEASGPVVAQQPAPPAPPSAPRQPPPAASARSAPPVRQTAPAPPPPASPPALPVPSAGEGRASVEPPAASVVAGEPGDGESRASRPPACPYCNGALPEGRRVVFCPSCGHNLTVQHCPACGSELEVGWKFCITCGRAQESPPRP